MAGVFLLSYTMVTLIFQMNHECKLCRLPHLLDGTAFKPFQYRMLIPWLAQGLVSLGLPLPFVETVETAVKTLNVISLFLTGVVFRYLIQHFVPHRQLANLFSFLMFYILPFNYLFVRRLSLWYPWDMTAILVFTLGLYFLVKENLPGFYLIFIVGTFNKETTCFLTLIYLLTAIDRQSLKHVALHTLVQILLWFGIKAGLWWTFHEHASTMLYQNKLMDNIHYLSDWNHLIGIASNFGFLWLIVLPFLGKLNNSFVRRSLFVLLIYTIGMFYVGNIYELRIFGEMIPVVLLSFIVLIQSLSEDHVRQKIVVYNDSYP
jgi:hypothetical protein